MAISRCPYCHAIIDENDKYCNNCGTQLLFSEDEEIEEEIPGEKIIEADVEEKDYTVEEPGDEADADLPKELEAEIGEEIEEEIPGEKIIEADVEEKDYTVEEPGDEADADLPKDLEAEIDEELEEEIPEETEEVALEELVAEEARKAAGEGDITEEVVLADEAEAGEAPRAEETGPVEENETADSTRPKTEAPESEGQEEDAGEPVIEYISGPEAPDEAATAGEVGPRPVTFDTKDLEDLGETVELGKQKVDEFVEVMAEEKAVTPPGPLEEPAAETSPQKTPTSEPRTGTLPPWASTMKGAPVFPEDTGPVETRKFRGGEPGVPDTEEGEVEIFPRRRAPDSTVGLPEKVAQAPLPFQSQTPEEVEEVEEDERIEEETAGTGTAEDLGPEEVSLSPGEVRPARPSILPVREPESEAPSPRGIEDAEEAEEDRRRPPFSLSVFFKSKVFDLLFVGLFWLVALWLAASSMGWTLFDVLGSMSGAMLALYAVFALLYFFLFKFFIGETIGDRLFRPRE